MKNDVINMEKVSVVRDGFNILTNVDWRVKQGQCCAVIGANGAGKSALVAVLSGYLWPQSGNVSVFGKTYGKVNLQEVRRHIGLIEPSRMPKFDEDMIVRHIVATGLFGTIMLPLNKKVSPQQWKKVDSQIAFFGLQKQKNLTFDKLSTGEQTKTLIVRAMISQPKMLILDEPTNGLDIGNRAVVLGVLNKLYQHKNPPAIIIVTHHLEELPTFTSQIVLLKKGKILEQGTPTKVLTSANLSKAFNCRVEVMKKNGCFIASAAI